MKDIFPVWTRAALVLLLAGCAEGGGTADAPRPDLAAPEGRYSGIMLPQVPGCGQPGPARLQILPGSGGGLDFRMDPSPGGPALAGDVAADGTLRVNMARTATLARAGDFGPGMANVPVLDAQLRPQGGISSVSGTLRTATCRWSFTLRRG